jgi:threonine/homoserine/homoserine lactone efflux protein
MLIVGGGAALTVIAAYFAWLGVKSLRAAWRARQAERNAASREAAHRHDAHENVHSSS